MGPLLALLSKLAPFLLALLKESFMSALTEKLAKAIDVKKLGIAAAAGVIAYIGLNAIRGLLTAQTVCVAGGLVAAYLVYVKVAWWELRRLQTKAQAAVDQVKATADAIVK